MSIDSRLMKKAFVRLDERREQRQSELDKRRRELYAADAELRELDGGIRATMLELRAGTFGENRNSFAPQKLMESNLELQRRFSERVTELGYPADWLDEKPYCSVCRDSGFVDSRACECLMELYREEQMRELSKSLKIGEERFESFDLSYYTEPRDREQMSLIYDTCLRYAGDFGDKSDNLLMTGGTGLGKTFLSTCIARVVSERGFFVVYDTAVSIFNAFEGAKFARSQETEDEFNELTERYMGCDLLIIDDLGTEMMTSFVTSAIYTIVNGRLISGKSTIINTNLSMDELKKRYSQQTMSRITGNYRSLPFRGQDIRQLKKKRA